ncbi:hypothetical protein SCLCIDRAFT_448238 [Scleroderma citrinum Foug A]|uniref:Uncharacterized protein n=1 Tax=Scleroderma citrinum Foug A TaxID=1036808 RepID=A0A0C3CXP3_9AGAM|nr:hypothetical protein SCLCIDRAFT_448238 [Scleroderma citrinum Foug A]
MNPDELSPNEPVSSSYAPPFPPLVATKLSAESTVHQVLLESRFNRDLFTSAQLAIEYVLRFECQRAGRVEEHEFASADLSMTAPSE